MTDAGGERVGAAGVLAWLAFLVLSVLVGHTLSHTRTGWRDLHFACSGVILA